MTHASVQLRSGLATSTGLRRSNNEDRVHADEAGGIFLVVDGMGGHAAGEKAAETAVAIVPAEFERAKGSVEDRVRSAITAANNEIYRLAESRSEWAGMACVLTLAIAHDERLTIGHVGDSRLYLAWTGGLRKLTSDHSPVGEREDSGDITEAEAMNDPRRHQVFRDVGSSLREPENTDFIEVKNVPLRPDAALLLCTDGLTDLVTNAEMNAIVQRYDGDPQTIAERLVDAANTAGGKDNVSVVFAAGPAFVGIESRALLEARTRHSVTRMRGGRWKKPLNRILWLLGGAILGIAGIMFLFNPANDGRTTVTPAVSATPERLRVEAGDPRALANAIAGALPGEVIEVAKGEYAGPIELKNDIELESASPGEAVIRAPKAGGAEAAVVIARNLQRARISGFLIEAGGAATGLLIDGANLTADEVEITGARDCGIHIQGGSAAVIRAGSIHNNGCGALIEGGSAPRLIGNRFSANTKTAIRIVLPANPTVEGNIFESSGTPIQNSAGDEAATAMLTRNVVVPSRGR